MKTLARLAAALLGWTVAAAPAAVTTTVVDVPVGTTKQRFLYVKPDAPIATVVSLAGGEVLLNIQDDGTMTGPVVRCNPVIRTRQAFAEAGFALALVDGTPQGFAPGLTEVEAVIAYVRARHAVPVWVIGGSSSTGAVADIAARFDPSIPAGAVLFSPNRISASTLAAVRRPAFVIWHSGDTGQFGSYTYNNLTLSAVRERFVLSGGTDTDCGYHLFQGLDAEFAAATTDFMVRQNAALGAPAAKFSALWYAFPAESEPGWGVNVSHQGDIVFATWFTYDAAGPMWLVMPRMEKVSGNLFRGAIYRTTGPAFSAVPFDPNAVASAEVGTGSLEFADETRATFTYSVNGIAGSKAITRQVFSSPVPRCTEGTAPSSTNFQDLWYIQAESGWGLNVAHQGDILFATWFTYAAGGKGRWLVMPGMQRVAGTLRYTGDVYETSGAPFSAYDPARLGFARVGSATFESTGASTATFSYTVDGLSRSKAITRQVFAARPTVCQ